jgi:pimeloyl-ACP methyl ester carboxylesterase
MVKNVTFSNKHILYTIAVDGPALVLVHGFLMDTRVWDDFVPMLPYDFKLTAIGLSGFGHSQMPGIEHDMLVIPNSVKAILDEEKIQKIVLTGHSIGGL